MSANRPPVRLTIDTGEVPDELVVAARAELVGVPDDMWATFAERASAFRLEVDGELAGFARVDQEQNLRAFYVQPAFEQHEAALFDAVVSQQRVSAAFASTVEPAFLSLCLGTGGAVKTQAIMYEHRGGSEQQYSAAVSLRRAAARDHSAAVAFDCAATESSLDFVGPYLEQRIDAGELYLLERHGEIVGTGECRVDGRSEGFAQLGLIVGAAHRRRGVGTSIMRALVGLCRQQGLAPVCSTEPSNLAAQHVIRQAGFRSRHRVLRVTF